MFINRRIIYLCRDDIKIDFEFIDILAIEIPKDELNTKNNIIIICLYRPPSIQENGSQINLMNFCNFLVERINIFLY